ncbi:hypothetical protein K3M67_06510 [Sphingobium sp. V4]|uniref:hypothetical protein n=1 Tax=Sphingobium sp. V4 TaxID=3038927 RepID=UPI002557CDB4|nr:hypothetical protein [Sphingobium sp. V4]WIW89606.1 hypothetical protein K3M67_06510 [Sphingobium sp. V4]
MPTTRDQMVDWLVDDTADTCSTDPGYLRSILREYWSAMSDEDLRRSYDELSPDEAGADCIDSGPTVTLRFRPQAWIRDNAFDVDPEQPDTWDIPVAILLNRFPTEDDWHEDYGARDDMRFEGRAPRWIREWSGPFEVELAPDAASPWELSATG